MNFAIENLGVGFACTGSEYILAQSEGGAQQVNPAGLIMQTLSNTIARKMVIVPD